MEPGSTGRRLRPALRRRRVLIGALIALVVVAGTAGGLLGFRLLGGSGDSLVSMAPGDSVAYVNVHLDPSAGQKLALNGLLDKFPALHGSARDNSINGWLDSALQSSGLTHADVRPWLGNDISLVMPASAASSFSSPFNLSTPDMAVLVASSDDGAAQAAVAKLRQKSSDSARWSTSTYDGVTVTATPGDAEAPAVFAVTDHALVVGSTESAVHQVIDTAQGKHPALASTTAYTTAVGRVPGDRVALVYMDVGALGQQALKNRGGAFTTAATGSNPYGGAALAVVAQNDGVKIDGVEDFDPSKLTPAERDQLTAPSHANGSLSFVPGSAYAAVVLTGLKPLLQGAIGSVGSAFGIDINSILDQLGITGPDGLVDHLTGDAGIDLNATQSDGMAGAVLIGTDSDAAAQHFVSSLADTLCRLAGCDPSQLTTEQYGGATITSIALESQMPPAAAGDSAVQPAWTVHQGWIIVGSNPAQVEQALDADQKGARLTRNGTYQTVMNRVGGGSDTGAAYIDVQSLVSSFQSVAPVSGDLAANVKPVKAVGIASHNASDHVAINVFVLIQ